MRYDNQLEIGLFSSHSDDTVYQRIKFTRVPSNVSAKENMLPGQAAC
jgi:hypothetical protein